MKRLTKEAFIDKAKKVHGDMYDYSKAEYSNSRTKVCIICPEHGEFWQTPNDHLNGHGCPKCCTSNVKKTTVQFIGEAMQVHGTRYDYSKAEYTGVNEKVCIICPEHGEFWQTPSNHLQGRGCPKCIGRNRTADELIEEFKKVHGDKYDYSKVDFKKMNEQVCIICPEHGEFWQTPTIHLQGCGCQKCANERTAYYQRLRLEDFIRRATKVHDGKYDYSKVKYVTCDTKVCIICPEHGEFWQLPYDHLCGKGCYKCAREKIGEARTLQFCEFLERAKKIM